MTAARRMAWALCALALCVVGCAHYSTSGGLVGGIRNPWRAGCRESGS